jgi:hypothetical protein
VSRVAHQALRVRARHSEACAENCWWPQVMRELQERRESRKIEKEKKKKKKKKEKKDRKERERSKHDKGKHKR